MELTGRPPMRRWVVNAALAALGDCLAQGGWFCLLLLGALADHSQDVTAQQLDVHVNLPYAVQFGFGSYDVGGLSVNMFRIPLQHTIALGPDEDAWRLALTAYLGYGHFSFETSALGPKIRATQDFLFALPQAELQIPLRRWWTLKPYVAAGFGSTFKVVLPIRQPGTAVAA